MVEKLIKNKKEIKRIPLYIKELDEQMEGGIPEGYITLISGTSGTMKSTLVFNVLYNEVLKGKIALYVSLEQSCPSLLNHLINVGFDPDKLNLLLINSFSELNVKFGAIKKSNKGTLIMADIGAVRKEIRGTKVGPSGDWLNVIKNIVKKLKEKAGCDLFVLDSLSALYVLSKFENPRTELFYTFEFLRDLGITTYLVSEMPLDKSKYGAFEIEDFLADGIIRVELVERQRKVTREISIVKMRATDCNIDLFTLEVKNGKFRALYGGQTALI